MRKTQTTAFTEKCYLYLRIARLMKLTIALILFACLQVSATGWSQEKITLKMTGTEIKKILFAIEKKSNYRFLFNEDALKGKPATSIDVVDATIPEILDKILTNTGI